ncbi:MULTISPECIES: DUF4190 domain-containing protein [unclassified Streptomyces]|uniref:DUF4190 domain-containing protein n=1 Tax=unclassified Streptomyces TaxID=2593676 RepID=UPI0036F134CB
MADQSGSTGGATGAQAPGASPEGAPVHGTPPPAGHGYPGGAPMPGGYGYPGGAPLPSGKATASMVIGILGLVLVPIILPIIALCLGVSARRMAARGEGGGHGQATAGMVLGIVGVAFAALGMIAATVQAIGGA